jgi:transcription termination factor Rho
MPTRCSGPKRFFGAARNIEEGGSLTDHRHRPDRYRLAHGRSDFRRVQRAPAIRKSFLDRKVSDKRVFPRSTSCAPGRARTSSWSTRARSRRCTCCAGFLAPMGTIDAIEFLLDKLRQSKTNDDFFESMNT